MVVGFGQLTHDVGSQRSVAPVELVEQAEHLLNTAQLSHSEAALHVVWLTLNEMLVDVLPLIEEPSQIVVTTVPQAPDLHIKAIAVWARGTDSPELDNGPSGRDDLVRGVVLGGWIVFG